MLLCMNLAFFLAVLVSTVVANISGLEKSATVWAWPVSAAKPTQLAQISYDPETLLVEVTKLESPEKLQLPSGLVRVGLYDTDTGAWRGSVTSSESFAERTSQHLCIHIDQRGNPYHITFNAITSPPIKKKAKSSKSKEREIKKAEKRGKAHRAAKDESSAEHQATQGFLLEVKISKTPPGPSTHLNKPVVLNADGKMAETEPEKTFLQKYWWVIGVFLLMQVAMAATPTQDGK